MDESDRYREFADSLEAAAAQSTDPHTKDVLLKTAQTWRGLADRAGEAAHEEQAGAPTGDPAVVDFARAARRLRTR